MFKAKQQLEKGKEKKGCSSKNTLKKVKSREKKYPQQGEKHRKCYCEHIFKAIPIAPILTLQKTAMPIIILATN